jgi:hypothetical protein
VAWGTVLICHSLVVVHTGEPPALASELGKRTWQEILARDFGKRTTALAAM